MAYRRKAGINYLNQEKLVNLDLGNGKQMLYRGNVARYNLIKGYWLQNQKKPATANS